MGIIENPPELPPITPTKASERFLKGWGDNLELSFNIIAAVSGVFMLGLSLAQGHNEDALMRGIGAGCGIATGIVKGLSMNIKK